MYVEKHTIQAKTQEVPVENSGALSDSSGILS